MIKHENYAQRRWVPYTFCVCSDFISAHEASDGFCVLEYYIDDEQCFYPCKVKSGGKIPTMDDSICIYSSNEFGNHLCFESLEMAKSFIDERVLYEL